MSKITIKHFGKAVVIRLTIVPWLSSLSLRSFDYLREIFLSWRDDAIGGDNEFV
jgi:hypothetical protein